ncbi:Catenin-beta-like protein [Pelagophyceae sp. CCMP2097]|nr:Catenin-beta-like protein [Pelagophyceae sp. CCMP2097]
MFEAAAKFAGARPGYVFTTRKGQTGYYTDGPEDDGGGDRKKRKVEPHNEEDETIAAILSRNEAVDVSELTPASLKHLMLSLEKKITRNSQLRVRFSSEPAKFVDSEIELDEAIKEVGVAAAAPELYPVLVDTGGVASIVGLLAHENADISASACGLLYDLTDAEALAAVGDDEVERCAVQLVEAVAAEHGLELLVQNLSRFDEFAKGATEADSQAVHHTLGIFEHVAEICGATAPHIVNELCEKTDLLKFSVDRARSKVFDANKLYASELLSILAAFSPASAAALAKCRAADGADGVDALLQAAAYYRRRSPRGEDEEECVENLFDALAAALSLAPMATLPLFLEAEGVELMLRCAREGRAAAACAIRVLDAALGVGAAPAGGDADGADDAPGDAAALQSLAGLVGRRLLDKGGLKVIFPALLGRGAARPPKGEQRSGRTRKLKRKKRDAADQRACDEHVLSIVAHVAGYAERHARQDDAKRRVVAKFVEDGHAKLLRLVDVYQLYAERTSRAAATPLRRVEGLSADEQRALEQGTLLEAGLHGLRLAARPLAFAAVHSPACRAALVVALAQRGATCAHVAQTLADEAHDLDDGAPGDDAAPTRGNTARDMLNDWASALLAIPAAADAANAAA